MVFNSRSCADGCVGATVPSSVGPDICRKPISVRSKNALPVGSHVLLPVRQENTGTTRLRALPLAWAAQKPFTNHNPALLPSLHYFSALHRSFAWAAAP